MNIPSVRKPISTAVSTIITLSLLISSCSVARDLLGGSLSDPPEGASTAASPPSASSSQDQNNASTLSDSTTSTSEPNNSSTTHQTQPEDYTNMGSPFYDVESSRTGLKHYAPFGDIFDLNRFERPFTQQDMTYVPGIDISQFSLVANGDWFYVFIKTIAGINANDPSLHFGVEIDIDRDGFGDCLLWTTGPYSTTWTTDGVKVLADMNYSSGGMNPLLSEAPLSTDGYETVLFDSGNGSDPDLAWVRISPQSADVVQIAFKKSPMWESFMWNAWADSGIANPAMFNYNDQITQMDAGSPIKESPYYPIKGLFLVDNT